MKTQHTSHTKETVVNTIEKTISPDKVVEMYDVALKKAEESVIGRLVAQDNIVNGVILLQEDPATQARKVIVKMQLNGRDIVTSRTLEDGQSGEDLLSYLHDEFSKYIVMELFKIHTDICQE